MKLEWVGLIGRLFIFLHIPAPNLSLQLKSHYGCGRSRFPVVIYTHCLFTRIRYFDLVLLYLLLLLLLLKIKIYRTIILPVVLYGCETWLLILREERKLMVFENMVLRRIFGPRREDVTGEWRKFYNEELNDLYSSPNNVRVIKSRKMGWLGMWRVWVRRGGVSGLGGETGVKEPTGET